MALAPRPKAGFWQAEGSKANKKMFIAGLVRGGVKTFNGRRSALTMIQDGSYIKNLDYNSKHVPTESIISSDSKDSHRLTINLDKGDINDHIHFALTGEHLL